MNVSSRFAIVVLCSLIVLATIFVASPKVKAAEQLLFEDNFENYHTGEFPYDDGWELWYSGAGTEKQVIVDSVSVSSTNSLKLLGTQGWAAFAAKPFTSRSSMIGFEASIMIENTRGQALDNARLAFTKKLSWAVSCEFAPVLFVDDGRIITGGQVLQNYEADKWYTVTCVMNRDTGTYSVWIDGELRGQDLEVTTTSTTITTDQIYELEAFSVSQCYNGVAIYVDNVKVFSVFGVDPKLELEPDSGIAATTLVGSGFAPGSKIFVTWNGTAIHPVPSPLVTDYDGNFTAIITVPNQTVSGSYCVKVVDEMNYEATSMFTVEPLVLQLSANSISSPCENQSEVDLVSSSETLTSIAVAIPTVLAIGVICTKNKQNKNKQGEKT
ncbi:MAG: hypothetical protein NWF02_01760 [Candidatus Bathyarchaeota archaeon]|nr:hypothetical protein [Candidatus Bathyarchaeum sp.]